MSEHSLVERSLLETLEFVQDLELTISAWINLEIDDSIASSTLRLSHNVDAKVWNAEPLRAQLISQVLAETLPFGCAAFVAMRDVGHAGTGVGPNERLQRINDLLPSYCRRTAFDNLSSVKALKLELSAFRAEKKPRLDFP